MQDIKNTKTYILQTFMYREYAEKFSKKIRSAIKALDPFAEGYEKTGYNIEGLEIYYKPYSTYLIFFVVEDATVTVIRVLKAIDYGRKQALYLLSGVREYWIVDPIRESAVIYRAAEDWIPMFYRFGDSLKAGIYEDLEIVIE